MKKVGIITLWDLNNYGNRLQNFALTFVLSELGYDPYTIVAQDKAIYNLKNRTSLDDVISVVLYYLSFGKKRSHPYRFIRMRWFTNRYIPSICVGENMEDLSVSDFEKVVIGSDQIWNLQFENRVDYSFAALFKKQNIVSYAPSFGHTAFTTEEKKILASRLSDIGQISIREDEGRELIKELIGVDCPVVLDPTMIVNRKDWESVCRAVPMAKKGKYVFSYFLGEKKPEDWNVICEYADENNLEIADVLDKNNGKYHASGPSEFLWLIKNASVVLTDSFHACVFSIIFHTPFVVTERVNASMEGRIHTLLRTFDLEKRWFNVCDTELWTVCDFKDADNVLERRREESMTFLRNAMQ